MPMTEKQKILIKVRFGETAQIKQNNTKKTLKKSH